MQQNSVNMDCHHLLIERSRVILNENAHGSGRFSGIFVHRMGIFATPAVCDRAEIHKRNFIMIHYQEMIP
jgi:hypothetical protein